jgi:hypothetical protein
MSFWSLSSAIIVSVLPNLRRAGRWSAAQALHFDSKTRYNTSYVRVFNLKFKGKIVDVHLFIASLLVYSNVQNREHVLYVVCCSLCVQYSRTKSLMWRDMRVPKISTHWPHMLVFIALVFAMLSEYISVTRMFCLVLSCEVQVLSKRATGIYECLGIFYRTLYF